MISEKTIIALEKIAIENGFVNETREKLTKFKIDQNDENPSRLLKLANSVLVIDHHLVFFRFKNDDINAIIFMIDDHQFEFVIENQFETVCIFETNADMLDYVSSQIKLLSYSQNQQISQ
jgi:hypothetical protein